MKTYILFVLFAAVLSLPARAAFAAPAVAADAPTETTFPTRAIVEAELGRKMKFRERVVYGILKRKAKRRAKQQTYQGRTGPVSALAIVSLVLGVLGIISIFLSSLALFTTLALGALVTGIIALVRFGGVDEYKRGRGLAIAGLAAVPGFIILGVLLLVAILSSPGGL